MTCALNVTSDGKNCVKYKRTQQRRMQLWPHKWDWWWSQSRRMIRALAVPPVVEMGIVTESKLVERYASFTYLSSINWQQIYNMLHNVSTKYQEQIKFCCCWIFVWARDVILFYWEFYESQKHTEYKQLNANFICFV